MRSISTLSKVWLLCLCAVSASAQEGLYGPPLSENIAMVRVLAASPALADQSVAIGAVRFGPLAYGEISPYRPVAADVYGLRIAGKEHEIFLQPGAYHTLVLERGGVLLLLDERHRDPARAQLFLYNISTLPSIDLKSADGKTKVIAAVPPKSSAMVVVNPAKTALGVFEGGTLIETLGDLGLRRGQSYSVFVLGEPGSLKVFAAQAAVAEK